MALFDVTVDNTKVAATYSNFPVLVDLSDMPAAFWSTVTNGGGDIRVYAADGTTELARDVVTCNTATDTGELWVKVPSLSGSADTVIKIDVDGARSDYAVGATYGRNAVWSDYWLVNHGEDLVDSAGNYGTLTEAGTVGAAAAVVGNGLSFGSGSDYCYTTTADVSAGDTFTQSFWFVATGSELPFDDAAFGIAASSNAFDNYAIHLTRALDTLIIEAFDRNTGSTFDRPISVPSVAIGDPVLIYATQTATGSDYTAIHNGITYTGTTDRRLQDSGFNRISLNRLMDSSPIVGGDMIIDEARLTKDGNARPVGWIETEYRNQTSPSTFYTVTEAAGGTEITASGAVQEQTIGNVTLTQGFSVSPNSLAQQQDVDSITLTQASEIAAQGLDQESALGVSALTQAHEIESGGVVQDQAVGSPGLAQASDLTPDSLGQTQASDGVTLQQAHVIVPAALGQDQDAAAVNLIQAHVLAADGVAQAQSMSSPSLSVAGDLLVSALAQITGLSVSDLIQAHVLNLDAVSQDHALAAVSLSTANEIVLAGVDQSAGVQGVTLTQAHIVAVSGLAQAQTVEQAAVSLADLLNIDAISQQQPLEAAGITQAYLLSVESLTQAQIAQAVNFGGVVVGSLKGEIKIYALVSGGLNIEPALKGNITIH